MTSTIDTQAPPTAPQPAAAPDEAAALIDYLRERDVPCPLCRYNLRRLTANRCPECGRELRLGVWLAEPRQAAWIVALIPLLLGAGIGLLVVFGTGMSGWATSSWLEDVTFVFFLACMPAAITLLAQRRRFLQFSDVWQWVIAAAAVVLFTVAMVGVMASMT